MKFSKLSVFICVLSISLVGCNGNNTSDLPPLQQSPLPAPEALVEKSFDYEASLQSVTEGSASGVAHSIFNEGIYSLRVELENLPLLDTQTQGYQGWLLKPQTGEVVTTGGVIYLDNQFVNLFSSEEDLTEYTQFQLSLEPLDPDTNEEILMPTTIILEGEFTPL